jgi:membrane-associated protease RseP (regulator of RpoE activity)
LQRNSPSFEALFVAGSGSEGELDQGGDDGDSPKRTHWLRPFALFVATLVSVFLTGATNHASAFRAEGQLQTVRVALQSSEARIHGALFAGTLLAILLAHEFGHYIAARLHRVPASLPHFIPVPLVSPFGTMGAVIRMSGRIKSANALLDIGASGPLCGLLLAIPLYAWGVKNSQLVSLTGSQENLVPLGSSLLLNALDALFGPVVPNGMDTLLSPVAYGAWAGMFVTMINLVPVGQLDGGHVAYALFGKRQDSFARWIHRGTLLFGLLRFAFLLATLEGPQRMAHALRGALFWLVWFQMLALLSSVSLPESEHERVLGLRQRIAMVLGLLVASSFTEGWRVAIPLVYFALIVYLERKYGVLKPHTLFNHSETDQPALSTVRTAIAWLTLAFFALLFMPTPMWV